MPPSDSVSQRFAGAPRTLLIASAVAMSGCYMAQEAGVDSAVDGLETGPSEEGVSSAGPLEGSRGILQADEMKLYWQHYSVWDGGACTKIRLKNEGAPVRGWQLRVEASDTMTYWADDGGAYFFPDGQDLWVEANDNAALESFDSVEMYYCAEPAVELVAMEAWWREGGGELDEEGGDDDGREDGDDGHGDGDEGLPGSFSGIMDYTDGSGNSARLSYASWITTSVTCLDFEVENTGLRTVVIERFRIDFEDDIDANLHEGGEVFQDQPDELTVVFPEGRESDPGDRVKARVCMDPLSRPQRLEEMVLTPAG